MRRYFARKLQVYVATFVVAVTVDWAIPRFMPGDPVDELVDRMHARMDAQTAAAVDSFYTKAFRMDQPWWRQYIDFWKALFHGDLGPSAWQFPRPVSSLLLHSAPYTLSLLVPAVVLSFYAGNKVGAIAARRRALDNSVLPVSYLLTATPYMWLAIVLAWLLGSVARVFPISGAYSYAIEPGWTWEFAGSYAYHWLLPFLTLFAVGFGGWAIGMRNMIIYELESDYAQYLNALGAPTRLVRRCAYRNAVLPQVTGLALALGTVIAGNFVTEIVFSYPGLGSILLHAIHARDYFLLQGIFLFVVVGVLVANFVVDVVYVVIDPRTRVAMEGGGA